jgi:polyphosphate kinase 2 (PPK2 family)
MAPKRAAGDTAKMKRKAYEKELRKLQVELCHLQDWVKAAGARIIILFEGRDAAGKGGTIKAITERVSPRVFRAVALPAPSDLRAEGIGEKVGGLDRRVTLNDLLGGAGG